MLEFLLTRRANLHVLGNRGYHALVNPGLLEKFRDLVAQPDRTAE
jgi:hypothetical protein